MQRDADDGGLVVFDVDPLVVGGEHGRHGFLLGLGGQERVETGKISAAFSRGVPVGTKGRASTRMGSGLPRTSAYTSCWRNGVVRGQVGHRDRAG
jgi:hypothetical protein